MPPREGRFQPARLRLPFPRRQETWHYYVMIEAQVLLTA